jgi:hypothetical protein
MKPRFGEDCTIITMLLNKYIGKKLLTLITQQFLIVGMQVYEILVLLTHFKLFYSPIFIL